MDFWILTLVCHEKGRGSVLPGPFSFAVTQLTRKRKGTLEIVVAIVRTCHPT